MVILGSLLDVGKIMNAILIRSQPQVMLAQKIFAQMAAGVDSTRPLGLLARGVGSNAHGNQPFRQRFRHANYDRARFR